MPQTEMLQGYRPGGDNDDDGRYIDWSTRAGRFTAFGLGNDDGESLHVWMTDDELRGLHAALTVHLLSKEH